mmetsp:Transcript_25777/g.71825  ORF Transcript_25777/g.71825 Transcript_25777/m.71825 type:complete len:135 (+) Transcript_25777:58-462(+)
MGSTSAAGCVKGGFMSNGLPPFASAPPERRPLRDGMVLRRIRGRVPDAPASAEAIGDRAGDAETDASARAWLAPGALMDAIVFRDRFGDAEAGAGPSVGVATVAKPCARRCRSALPKAMAPGDRCRAVDADAMS